MFRMYWSKEKDPSILDGAWKVLRCREQATEGPIPRLRDVALASASASARIYFPIRASLAKDLP